MPMKDRKGVLTYLRSPIRSPGMAEEQGFEGGGGCNGPTPGERRGTPTRIILTGAGRRGRVILVPGVPAWDGRKLV
jgi:hypothetical protein